MKNIPIEKNKGEPIVVFIAVVVRVLRQFIYRHFVDFYHLRIASFFKQVFVPTEKFAPS
jgi:hypothetical protein